MYTLECRMYVRVPGMTMIYARLYEYIKYVICYCRKSGKCRTNLSYVRW